MLSIGSAQSLYSLNSTIISGTSQITTTKASLALSGTTSSVTTPSYSGGTTSLSWESQSFLDGYSSKLTELSSAASSVLAPSNSAALTAGSSDNSVATVSGNVQSENSHYTVEVSQVATAQVNSSVEFAASDPLPTVGGSLNIETNSGTFRFSLSSASADTNEDALTKFAAEINSANSGVVATVVERSDNTVALELEGVGSDFVASGSFADTTGLSEVNREAQQAVFTVTDNTGDTQQFSSSTNSINVDGVDINLRSVGTTEITASQNGGEALADALSKMVDAFNSTVNYLEANESQGIGVLNQLQRMATPPTSTSSMQSIGISMHGDGTMSFDRTAFLDAYSSDEEITVDIAEDIASSIQIDAERGLSEPSGSLVSNSLTTNETTGVTGGTDITGTSFDTYNFSNIDFYNSYNSSGVYNMSNYYAVGAMLNILV